MNRLNSNALAMAKRHRECCNEECIISIATCPEILDNNKVPYIQRQAFAERAHYFWLCLTRGVAI
jgi:hypothetical protein